MSSYDGTERRRTRRVKLVTFCPANFELVGEHITAMMIDVSDHGGGFKISGQTEEIPLYPGDEIEYEIRTPYGPTTVKGKTMWTRVVSDGYAWGVAFTNLSDDEQDPLRCLMDSPF